MAIESMLATRVAASSAAPAPGATTATAGPPAAPAGSGAPSTAGATAALASGRAIVAAMTALTSQVGEAAGWSPGDRSALLADLDRAIDGLSVVRGAVLVADRDAGVWRGAGDRSYEAARGRTSGAGARAAGAQVRQAEQLDAAPVAAAAVVDGRITAGHAAVLGKVAATGTPTQRALIADPAVQRALVEVAERQDAGTFQVTVDQWVAGVDPDGFDRQHQAERCERYLHLSQSSTGTFLKGRLDPIAGHKVALALEALSPRPAEDDDRDPGQRRADALTDMAEHVLADPGTKPGGHVPPQITMILTPDTWVAARSERDRRRRAAGASTVNKARTGARVATGMRAGAGGVGPVAGDSAGDAAGGPVARTEPVAYPAATLEDGTPVPVSELAAAMCDCDLTRAVIDADGTPLDLGRSQRLFTGQLRKVIIARDRECGWPSCHAPARWCQIHHITWWDRDNGPTSADNGILMCGFHHHETHRRDLVITRAPGTATATSPPGRSPGTAPPGPLARATYRFRDRTGRDVGTHPGAAPPRERHHPTPDAPSPAVEDPSLGGAGPPGTGCDAARVSPLARPTDVAVPRPPTTTRRPDERRPVVGRSRPTGRSAVPGRRGER
ncbi:DUF222 domain-containing protein [Cellulomonas sp. ATA003]|uniref:HNH endonuclease signature motif containing protein n=1 Tax=Cellulomonas sp. ATA003 TaxID=3073064 RepID=UPI00287354BE|nr:DUF222 domain-containing protein [Cellulomonas sp. ATA003]WNB86031.1 DUF222 domain-containing protein [Cellulomonas sp. ATA003]